LWILGAFYTFPTLGIEAITGLIPIHLHLQKLSRTHQLRMSALLSNHTVKSLLKNRHTNNFHPHHLFLKNMSSKQRSKIKSSIVDINNCLNGIFPLFNFLNNEFFPESRLIDIFSSHFSFHWANCKNKESNTSYIHISRWLIIQSELIENNKHKILITFSYTIC